MEAQQQQQQQPQQQQQQYLYQYQPQNDTVAPQSYDPSQIQAYDQSTQAYYAYQYPANQYIQPQQQDYSSYYYQDYSTSYQTQVPTTDPNLIHPPGVPLSVDSQQTLVQNPQNLYYPHGAIASQPLPQGFLPPDHSAYLAGGSQAGRSVIGRGSFGRPGRGRGGGRGKPQVTRSSAPAEGQAAPSKTPRMAWCEVCRTDCTTLEVLEQHKNGKRHKRNLKVHEHLQNLSRQLATPNPESIPTQGAAEGSHINHPPGDNVAPDPAGPENKSDKPATSGPLPSQESVIMDHFGGRGGFKRKMRGGAARGGKWVRAFDGSRRPVEPPKPKQVVPLICDLCNVKCESQVVYESHIAGKKHLANLKRFQGHKEALGEGVQALYPSVFNLLPSSTSIISQANQPGPTPLDSQAFAAPMLSQQTLQDPQAAQAALAQLLHQHGIHDTQTLIAQLIPYLLAQCQGPTGSLPVLGPAAGFGLPTQNTVTQGAHIDIPTGTESQNVTVESQPDQQNVTSNVESQAVAGENKDKPTDALPKTESQP